MRIQKPKINKINTNSLKPKRRKVGNNVRSNDRTCPNCLSSLKVSREGIWFCSGNRLQFWEKECILYSSLKSDEKEKFLEKFSDPNKFKEMHMDYELEKKLSCGYSSRIFYPISSSSVEIPDPIVVGRIEKSLKRALTEEELQGNKKIWMLNGEYISYYKEDAIEVEIPTVSFPEEV